MKQLMIVGIACLLWTSIAVASAALTAAEIARAHEAGVSTEILLQLVESAPDVAAGSSSDERVLRDAGVAEAVIAAYLERSRAAARSHPPGGGQPDDARLVDVVKLVRSGLENDLVIDHVRRADTPFQLTVNDLIYLQQQEVPEAIIRALLSSADAAGETLPTVVEKTFEPTPTQNGEVLAFQPLVRFTKMAGMITRKTDGRLLLGGGTLQWIDEEKPDLSFEFFESVIKKVYLECEAASCFEIRIKTVHGDDYRFRDDDWKVGGSTQITALWETLKSRNTKVKFLRKD